MLSPRLRKVLTDIWSNKTRLVLVVLSIAVGVFAVGMIAGANVVLSRDLPAAYMAVNPASATLYTDPADEDFVASLANMKGVSDAERRRTASGRGHVEGKDWHPVSLVAVSDFDDIRVNKLKSLSGDWPPARREIVVERASLEFLGARVGDTLVAEMPDGKQYELRISGVAHDVNSCPPMVCGVALTYVTLDTMEWLGYDRSLNEISIVVAENQLDKAHIQDVAKQVSDKIEKSGRSVYYTYLPDPGKHPADSFMQTFMSMLGVLGGLALALAGFLVVNTISALVFQQTRQIGIMKAIGARRSQVIVMYLATVCVFGLIALTIGIPLGALAAQGFGGWIASICNFDATTLVPPIQVFAMQAAIGLAVPLLAALWPVIGGTRITVREALNAYDAGKGKRDRGLLDRLVDRLSIFSRPLRLSLRNTFRRKGRLALTLITLTLASATFIGVFSVRDSSTLTLDEAINYFNYDVQVSLRRPFRTEQIESTALSIPGVSKVETLRENSVRRVRPDGKESNNYAMLSLEQGTTMIRPIVLQGRWLRSDDENAVVVNTLVTKDEPDLKVGDAMVIKINDREITWRVVGIVRGVMTGPIIYVNDSYYGQVVRDVGTASTFWVTTDQHDAAFRAGVIDNLKETFKAAGMPVSSTDEIAVARERIQAAFNIVVGFLMVMAALLGVVGGLGLMGTMSLNVLERTREIGVMRAIGASDGAVRKLVIVEGVLIGILAWLAGAIVAFPMGRVLSDTVGWAFTQSPLSYVFSASGALIWLGVVIILAAVSSLLPARKASKLSIREVLAYE